MYASEVFFKTFLAARLYVQTPERFLFFEVRVFGARGDEECPICFEAQCIINLRYFN